MPSKAQSILLGGGAMGVAIAIFDFIPVIGQCLCIAALIGAGVLAVWHYTSTYNLTITGGTGAGMGAAAAVVAGIVDALFGLLFAALGLLPGFAEARREVIEGMEAGGMDPEQVEAVRQFIESPFFLPGIFLCAFLVYVILGAVGGAIGAASFKKGGPAPEASTAPASEETPPPTY